jgi:hypothetical protein
MSGLASTRSEAIAAEQREKAYLSERYLAPLVKRNSQTTHKERLLTRLETARPASSGVGGH